jgi:hypothetical protein
MHQPCATRIFDGDILVDELNEEDRCALDNALAVLERPTLTARLGNVVGKPVEFFGRVLPASMVRMAQKAAEAALTASLKLVLSDRVPRGGDKTGVWHKVLAATSGAMGGTFGITGLAMELPISTAIILHAITEIAREQGEDLRDPDTLFACLEVFALADLSHEHSFGWQQYCAVRHSLSGSVAEASRYVGQRVVAEETAPALARIVSSIASRFGVAVSQKFSAQAIPIIGSVSGAAINALFMEHFQSMARVHFTMRRLERTYGKDRVAAYCDDKRISRAS